MGAFVTALTSAIPLIEKVVTTIWGQSNGNKSKKDATAAVSPLKQVSAEALKSVSDQLSLVATLLEACFPAEDFVVGMQAVLDANKKGELSADEKREIQRRWNKAKTKIKKIADRDMVRQIRAIDDTFTRDTFLKLANASTDDIDGDIREWALSTLTQDLKELSGYLDAVNDVAVQVTAGIAQGLEKLAAAQSKPTASARGAGGNE